MLLGLPTEVVNDKGRLLQQSWIASSCVGRQCLAVSREIVRQEKTVGAAGRSRSLWFIKSKLSLAFAPIRSPFLNWNSRRRPCSIRSPRFILVGATHSLSTGSSRGTEASPG